MGRPQDQGAPLDLQSLDLSPGEARHVGVALRDEEVTIGGAPYRLRITGGVADVDVTNAHSGWHIRLRVEGAIDGPCWRCLEPAAIALAADLSDFGAFGRSASDPFDEDLDSEYIVADHLDAAAMARDGLLEGVPTMILCRPDCAGLCPTCGANLNAGPCGCPPPAADSRWDALNAIRERLEPPDA